VEVSLIDGDTYEDRNRERQVFHVNGPKADVTADRLRREYPGIYFWPHPVYLTEDNVVLMIRDGDVVFSCVDNHATRKLVSDRCEELDNITLISGGNDFTDGNIQVYVKRDGKELSLPITNKYHPEIANPADKNPADAPVAQAAQGCQAVVNISPQLIFTNNSIAAKMLECYYTVMMGQLKYDEVYVDILTGASRPVKRPGSPAVQ
jgi:molybdopterin/thiamine biosynthesis adenylyltransferase